MGIEGRDYYRESSRYTDRLTGWGWRGISPVCKWVILANIAVFLLQIFITRPARPSDFQQLFDRYRRNVQEDDGRNVQEDGSGIDGSDSDEFNVRFMPRVSIVQQWFQLETSKVLHGQIWRLLTHAFCHDRTSILHLLINMLFFYWFGPTLETMYGSREFLLFYLSAAVLAGVAFVGLDLITGDSIPAIGASGAVMAVTMLYAYFYPRTIIYIMLIIPIEIRWLVVLYVIFDLHPVLLALAGDRMDTGVAHAAHLGGLAFGFVYAKFNLRLEPFVASLRAPRWGRMFGPKRTFRVYRPTHEDVEGSSDSEVDDILRKIRDHGSASLTEKERQILIEASRRYRNR